MQTSHSLAAFLDELSATLKEAATAVRTIDDRAADLPPTLRLRHIARFEGWSDSTTWRKAKLGRLGPTINGPGEPIAFDRDTYLHHRRRRVMAAGDDTCARAARGQATDHADCGRACEPADAGRMR
jgi:hypothetical protein